MADQGSETGIVLSVRLIRSFEYRNIKPIPMKNVDLNQTTKDFMEVLRAEAKTRPGIPPPFRNFTYDTLKIQHKAHHAKTNDPVIRTDDDDKLILKEELSLAANDVEHETELSFFKLEDYLKYKENPELKW